MNYYRKITRKTNSERMGAHLITETHIKQWSDRTEARSLLPILVRRLVRETTPLLTSMRFPGNDAIALHGVDGETDADASTLWVPSGVAFWEMGCDKSPSKKATEDYDKRSRELDVKIRQSGAFIFVTPRRWPSKSKWLLERRSRGDWAKVYAWDAVDIETWLEEAPQTRVWLAERLTLPIYGLTSPEDWYQGWASASTPSIPQGLVAVRRGGMGETLAQKLRKGDRTVPVVADSRQEAVAFSIAAMTQSGADDLLDRMVVVTSPDAVPGAGTGPKPILVLDLPNDEEPALGDRNRFQIIRPMAKGQIATREQIELPHVAADTFRRALEEVGLSRHDANRKALEVGHSVTVMRRRLSDDPAVRLPEWARDSDTARKLLPHALVGGWIESEHHDDVAMLALLADTTEANVLQAGRDLVRYEDAPLARIGNVTIAVSHLDSLFAVGTYIEPGDLDSFFLLLVDAFGERDPKLDLPEDEWWCANIHGKTRTYSGALLSGLGDTLGIFAAYGEAICGNRLGTNLSARINRHVRDLMSEMTPDAWFSIRPHLRIMAEAAPVAFLDCVEADLDCPDQPISSIMRCAGDAGLSRECLRTELLWALETLAWSSDYFPRVAEIVFRLCAFSADDNYANNPENTAAALFRDWVPSTTLSIEDRMSVLYRLAPDYRSPAIEVCKSLIASGPRFASRTAMPRWLSVEGDYKTVTDHDRWNAQRSASKLLLDLTPLNQVELNAVLDAYDGLHPDDLKRLCAEVERWSEGATDMQKAVLAKSVRQQRGQMDFRLQRSNDGEDDSRNQELLEVLDHMLAQLQPHDPRQRHLWLFEQDYIQWPELDRDEVDGKIGWRERDALVQTRRRDVLAEIEGLLGSDALYAFALSLEHPHIVARVLAGTDVPEAQTVHWAARAMRDADGGTSADLFLAQTLFIHDDDILENLVVTLEKNGLLNEQADRERLGRSLPNLAAGWRLAEKIGGAVKKAFWSNAQIQIFRDEDANQAEFVAQRLLEAGRPRSAYAAAHYEPEKLAPDTWIEILEGIIRGEQPEGPLLDRWHLVRILQRLDEASDISDGQIAALELPLAKLLEGYGAGNDRPIWAIHRIIMQEPSEYVAILNWHYKRDDGASEPDLEAIDTDQIQIRASLAYHVFHSWSEIPGTRADGTFNEVAFRSWSEEMLRLAEEDGRLWSALSCLADCLARVANRRGMNEWLPDAVLKFLDRPDLRNLRRSFEIGVSNARGVTTRGCYDGGAQERGLAKKYRELSARKSNSFPRVAAMIENIAGSYERDAARHDEQAELGERWHP